MSAEFSFAPSILRSYDIRGIVGETIDAETYRQLGVLLGSWTRNQGLKSAVLGYDGRLSSPELAHSLTQGVISTGLDVIALDCVPTPALYHAQHLTQAGLALMVTGSHNPPNYNGLKIMMGGLPFYGEDIAALQTYARDAEIVHGDGACRTQDIAPSYIDMLLGAFNHETGIQRPLNIGWDPGNGATGEMVVRLTEHLPGTHHIINGDIDGNFPNHHPDPSKPENMAQLQELVTTKKLDFGIGFDGDGDRIGVIDGAGRILAGDRLLPILAYDVLQELPQAVILADVKTSSAAIQAAAELGGEVKMVATGHSLVKTAMRSTGAAFAAEMSGHIFFRDNHNFDDALYAAVKLMNRVGSSGRSLQQLADALPQNCSTPEIRIPVAEPEKFKIIDDVIKAVRARGLNYHDIDGMRIDHPTQWWLVRASNTENALIFRAEAEDDNALATVIVQAQAILRDCGVEMTETAAKGLT